MHKRFTSCCKTMILVYWIFFLKQMKFAKPITNLSKNSKKKNCEFPKKKERLVYIFEEDSLDI